MIVEAEYSDGTSEEINGYTFSPSGELTTDVAITVSYQGFTATTQTMKVRNFTSIEINAAPDKTEYVAGESFDPTGMEILLVDDDTQEFVDLDGGQFEEQSGTFSPSGPLTTSDTTITLSWQGLSTTQAITVDGDEPTPIDLHIDIEPNKMVYEVGESFDPTGMTVILEYDDETAITVNDYTYSPSGPLTINDTTITISYQGFSTTLNITVTEEATLTGISITEAPWKVNYIAGETIELEGIRVTASYSTGRSEDITQDCDYSPDGSEPLTTNDTTVTASYEGFTATTPIRVYAQKEAINIEVTEDPDKVEYMVGESFDPTGMTVEVNYNNGDSEEISDYTYSPSGLLTINDTTITISYQGFTSTVSIEVEPEPEE